VPVTARSAIGLKNDWLQSENSPNFKSMPPTVSISEAKQRLGEFADRAIQGEQIVIIRKSKLLVLKQLEIPEPVPIRPDGYFDDCYDRVAVKESNKLAASSVRKIVK
jgi:hypothetical protein